jgi:glycosyltransferase involved in cell wall biosynthesis
MPNVSVIMPCYNHARYVKEAVEGILAQTFGDLELIITDDCSKDNSPGIIHEYEKKDPRVIGIYHRKNEGEGKSRNDAMAKSSGKFIAFCDSDDIWENEKLETQLPFFKKFENIDAIHSDSIIIDENSTATGKRFSSLFQKGMRLTGDLFNQLCLRNVINVPTVILRRKCLSDAGWFEEDFRYLADWIYWIRVARKNTFFYIDEPLARYRVHSQSTSRDSTGFMRCRIKGLNLILNSFPEIPDEIKSTMFYSMGNQFLYLGEKDKARSCYKRSLMHHRFNLRSLSRLTRLYVQGVKVYAP